MDPKKKAKRILTDALSKLADEIETVDNEGDPITKAAALARTIWVHALGGDKVDPKNGKRIRIKSQPWAIQLIFDRIEGRVQAVMDDEAMRPSTLNRIEELVTQQLNKVAEKHATGDRRTQ